MDAHHHTVPPLASRGHLVMSEAELVEWGEHLGADSHPQLVIALTGELDNVPEMLATTDRTVAEVAVGAARYGGSVAKLLR